MLTAAKPRLTLVFKGVTSPMLPTRAVNNYYIILNVSSPRLRTVSKQSRSSEYLSLYFVFRNQTLILYGEPYAHKF